jgi:predicted O-methyltransferase YrrM
MHNLEGGRIFDEKTGLIFPWYTKPFLDKLLTWDISNWKVFEYGCGDSTLWWKNKVKTVVSVDTNKEWADKVGAIYYQDKDGFINSPLNFIEDSKFDCVIIDSEPVEWRDECVLNAIKVLKENGVLIIDNFRQKTVNLEHWPKVDELLSEKFCEVFKEENHQDWKTAYWLI